MASVNMLDAKTNLSKRVDSIERGLDDEIIIARNGRPAARLVPIRTSPKGKRIGPLKGRFTAPSLQTWMPTMRPLRRRSKAPSDMRLLLDTHIALWALTDDPRLGKAAREHILADDNAIHVSAASVREIATKHGLGRGGIPFTAADALRYFEDAGYTLLPVTARHAASVEQLPLHHADPFDRILWSPKRCTSRYAC